VSESLFSFDNPYYADDFVTLYHGDCRALLGEDSRGCFMAGVSAMRQPVMLTDPPYGISYKSNSPRAQLAASIEGDEDTSLRDEILEWWGGQAALVFGTWRVQRPAGTKARLIWDTKGALGMGDTTLPWKPSDQEIYVLGRGFSGPRTSNVLTYAPVQSMARNGRVHPHEKPVPLLCDLLQKCPDGLVVDPFAGSGSTLVAAKKLGRRALGIEIDERYCEIAARRCAQEVLEFVA
jgi:hypothetical protein